MINVIYCKNRIHIFSTEESISYHPNVVNYWNRKDRAILINYTDSLGNQIFKDDSRSHTVLNRLLSNYTNVSKIHIYLYPLTISEVYYNDYELDKFKEEVKKVKDLLPSIVKQNAMFVMDRINEKIAYHMKKYDRKSIRIVYHLNNQNFFEENKKKNDSIYVYEIKVPEPNIIRKM